MMWEVHGTKKLNVSYLVFILPMVVLRYTDLLDANLYLLTKMYFFAILTDINVFLRHSNYEDIFSTSSTASVFIRYYAIVQRYIFNMPVMYFF